MEENLSLVKPTDFVGVLIYLIIIYWVLYKWKNSHKETKLAKYIIPVFTLRIISSFFQYYITQFIYKGGDVFFYFRNIKIYSSIYRNDPTLIPEILFNHFNDLRPGIKSLFDVSFETFSGPNVFIGKTGSILALIFNDNFLCISITFSLLSTIGIWKLYLVFVELYPQLYKKLAYGILFLPSVFFWGSGLVKDPLCMYGLGILFFYFYKIVFKKRITLINLALLSLGVFILLSIKPYILFAFSPSLLVWFFFNFNAKIKSSLLRRINTSIIYIVLPIIIFLILNNISNNNSSDVSRFAVSNLMDEIKSQQEAYIDQSNGETNSFVSIGDFDQSFSGLIKSFPLAVNLTLFRPYVWEIKNGLMILSAGESLFFLVFLLMVFFKIGFFKTFQTIFKTPILFASFIFVIVFAGFVGISTFNFGTIARYKIPCLPFFIATLIIIYDQRKNRNVMQN